MRELTSTTEGYTLGKKKINVPEGIKKVSEMKERMASKDIV